MVEAFPAWVAGGGGPVAWDMIRGSASTAASSKIVSSILDQILFDRMMETVEELGRAAGELICQRAGVRVSRPWQWNL